MHEVAEAGVAKPDDALTLVQRGAHTAILTGDRTRANQVSPQVPSALSSGVWRSVTAKPPPTPRQARRHRAKNARCPPGALGLLAGGGALALAGVGLLAGAWTTGNQARADGTSYADLIALNDKGRALNTGGMVLSVVGAALAVGGAVWGIVPSRKE